MPDKGSIAISGYKRLLYLLYGAYIRPEEEQFRLSFLKKYQNTYKFIALSLVGSVEK